MNVKPGDKAYFLVWGPDQTGNPKNPCINAAIIESTPPGGTIPLVFTTPHNLAVCDGLSISSLAPYSYFQ